jgi:hypothetical protein
VQELISRLLSLDRQRQLLGSSDFEGDLLADCGLGNLDNLLRDRTQLPCITDWLGSIGYAEKGSFSTNFSSYTGHSRTQTEDTEAHMQLLVSQAALVESGGSPNQDTAYEVWKLIFTGKYAMKGTLGDHTVVSSETSSYEHTQTEEDVGQGTLAFQVSLRFEAGVLKAFQMGSVTDQEKLARIQTDDVVKETTEYKDAQGNVTSSSSSQYSSAGSSTPVALYMSSVDTNLFTAVTTNHVAGLIKKANATHENKRGIDITYTIDLQQRPK